MLNEAELLRKQVSSEVCRGVFVSVVNPAPVPLTEVLALGRLRTFPGLALFFEPCGLCPQRADVRIFVLLVLLVSGISSV